MADHPKEMVCPNCGGREYFATGFPTCVRCKLVVGEDGQKGVLMVNLPDYVKKHSTGRFKSKPEEKA